MLFNAPQRCDSLAILGDLNYDISHPDKGSREGRTLVDLMNEYNMTNLFREPTRATATSSTFIDVILTNRPRSFLTSGTLDLGLIDHHLDYAVSRSHRPRIFPITGERRTVKNYDPERFCDDLHSTPSDIPYTFEDIDDIYWAWSYLLSSILDNHAPIKRKTANLEHVSFMTPELLEAIRKRNKLKRLYNESKRRLDWDRYKTQRNLTSSLRRKAVSNYFRTTASNATGNPMEFWQTVKLFMH